MTMDVQGGRGLAALRSSQSGASFIQTIVLSSALALGTAVAVKSLSGRIGETLDCTGQKVTALGLGAGGCAEGGGEAPVALDFGLVSAETPIAQDPVVGVAPASLSLSPVPTPTPGATPIAPAPELTPPAPELTPPVQATPTPTPTPTPSIAPIPELTPTVPVTPAPEATPTPSPEPGPSPDPNAPTRDRPPDFVDGFVGGDFTECESFGCAAGQAISGFIPFVGDGRDAIANSADCAAGEGCGDLVFTGIGFIPLIGDLIKGGRKVFKAADAADAARRADPPAGDPAVPPAKDPADTVKGVSGSAADIARLGGRVVDISKLKVNPNAKNRIFLGHFGGRGLIVNGRLIRVPSPGLQALESLAKEHGGRTLADFPGDITAIAPEIRNADEIIFNVGERGIGAGTLTAEELAVIVNEGLLDKVTFVTGLTF